jgi:NitT/TauT family transport system permease protein
MRTHSFATSLALGLIPVVVLLAIWEASVAPGSRGAFLLSRPSDIWLGIERTFASPQFWTDLTTTSQTLVGGYLTGVAAGFVTGVVVWLSGRNSQIGETYLLAMGAIPLFALAPLLIFIFGIGAGTRLLIVFLSVWIPVSLAVYSNARDVELRYLDLLRALRANKIQQLRAVVAPGAFFLSLPAVKASVNTALVATFVSEWISAQNGLAKSVLAAMSIYDVPRMWAGLLTFVALSVLFSAMVAALEASLTRWRRSARV